MTDHIHRGFGIRWDEYDSRHDLYRGKAEAVCGRIVPLELSTTRQDDVTCPACVALVSVVSTESAASPERPVDKAPHNASTTSVVDP